MTGNETIVDCDECQGEGQDANGEDCDVCRGKGTLTVRARSAYRRALAAEVCGGEPDEPRHRGRRDWMEP